MSETTTELFQDYPLTNEPAGSAKVLMEDASSEDAIGDLKRILVGGISSTGYLQITNLGAANPVATVALTPIPIASPGLYEATIKVSARTTGLSPDHLLLTIFTGTILDGVCNFKEFNHNYVGDGEDILTLTGVTIAEGKLAIILPSFSAATLWHFNTFLKKM